MHGGFAKATLLFQGLGQILVGGRIPRLDSNRFFKLEGGFVEPLRACQNNPEVIAPYGLFGIDSNCLGVMFNGLVELAALEQGDCKIEMSFCVIRPQS